jgi:hypothetical protein
LHGRFCVVGVVTARFWVLPVLRGVLIFWHVLFCHCDLGEWPTAAITKTRFNQLPISRVLDGLTSSLDLDTIELCFGMLRERKQRFSNL